MFEERLGSSTGSGWTWHSSCLSVALTSAYSLTLAWAQVITMVSGCTNNLVISFAAVVHQFPGEQRLVTAAVPGSNMPSISSLTDASGNVTTFPWAHLS